MFEPVGEVAVAEFELELEFEFVLEFPPPVLEFYGRQRGPGATPSVLTWARTASGRSRR